MNNDKISIIVIDSEPESLNRTIKLLHANSMVSEVITASNTDQAILKVIKNSPDLILYDYPSKGNSEKELIEFVKTKLPETTLVFVSQSKENATFAIQNGIYSFLLRPIKRKKLDEIITTAIHTKQSQSQSRINQIIESTPEEVRFRLQTTKGYLMLNMNELIYCKAIGPHTGLYLTKGRVEIACQLLLKFEEMLEKFNFIRVSRSHIINQRFIRKIHRINNTIVLSSDGKEYEIKAGKIHIKNLSKFDTE